jgi:hypothetical protein
MPGYTNKSREYLRRAVEYERHAADAADQGDELAPLHSITNSELLEYRGYAGSLRNTTIEGAINGMELHLGVIMIR